MASAGQGAAAARAVARRSACPGRCRALGRAHAPRCRLLAAAAHAPRRRPCPSPPPPPIPRLPLRHAARPRARRSSAPPAMPHAEESRGRAMQAAAGARGSSRRCASGGDGAAGDSFERVLANALKKLPSSPRPATPTSRRSRPTAATSSSRPGSWTPSSAATRRSAAWCASSRAAPRTTRSSSARPAWERRPPWTFADETDADGTVRVRSVPRNSTGEANPHLAGISSLEPLRSLCTSSKQTKSGSAPTRFAPHLQPNTRLTRGNSSIRSSSSAPSSAVLPRRPSPSPPGQQMPLPLPLPAGQSPSTRCT